MRGFWADMPNAKAPRCARKAPIGDQRHFLTHTLPRKRRRCGQHFAHARAASRPFIADHKHVAFLIGSVLNGLKRILLAFKYARRPGENLSLFGHARNFHNRAFGRQIACQTNNTTGFCQRSGDRVNHPPISFAGDFVQIFPHAIARGGETIFVQQPGFAQFFHHNRHAAHLVKIFCNIFSARLKIHKIGCVAENLAHIFKIKINAGLMCNRWQMQPCIGRASGACYYPRGVFKRFQRHHIARPNILFKQGHHGATRSFCVLIAAFIRGGSTG